MKRKCKWIYGARAVADFTGQTVRTVRRKFADGRIPHCPGAGGAVAVRVEDAESAAEAARRERRGHKKGGAA